MRKHKGLEPWTFHVHNFGFFVRYWDMGITAEEIKRRLHLKGDDSFKSVRDHLISLGRIQPRKTRDKQLNQSIRETSEALTYNTTGRHMDQLRMVDPINFAERCTQKKVRRKALKHHDRPNPFVDLPTERTNQ